jgi:vacuolar-type H+-ATPase subunit H
MNPLREQREYAVREAAQREREAWSDLERAARPNATDDTSLRTYRERWQATAHTLVDALRALKR